MLSSRNVAAAFVTLALLAPPLYAAEPPPGSPGRPSAPKGPWPPKRLIEAGLRRLIRETTKRYKLDAKQVAVLERQFLTRWPAFLEKHRPVLQKAVNEYLEVVIVGDPPTREQVARWAKAVQPVVEASTAELDGTYEEVRKVLRPEQIKSWDRDRKSFMSGKKSAEIGLGKLARGQFDPRHWRTPWPKPPMEARMPAVGSSPDPADPDVTGAAGGARSGTRGNRFRARRPDAPGPSRYGAKGSSKSSGPTDAKRRTRPLDAWESYVKQFIKRHNLDTGQANTAMAILEELRNQGKVYETKHAAELKRLARAVSAADPAARPNLQAQLNQLRHPINNLFDELRSRLDDLLTGAQRQGAQR